MKCKSPFFVKDQKILVPCGKCLSCRINKRSAWTGRMILELQSHSYAMFLTLTYSDENLPDPPYISKRELQLFFKRLRKACGNHKLRYYACGEYGEGKGRPHYHAIVYGLSSSSEEHRKLVSDSWKFGFVYFGDASMRSMQYVAGYVAKKLNKWDDDRPPEFTLMSRRPALGSQMLDKLKDFAFIQNPYDVLSVIKVGKKSFCLDRTIRNKLRALVMTEAEADHIKKLRVELLREEVLELVGKHYGAVGKHKFRTEDYAYWEATQAYHSEYYDEIHQKEHWIARRTFRKDT